MKYCHMLFLSPLESAQENARRLTGNPELILPYPECCTTNKNSIVSCSTCGVEYCSVHCQNEAFNRYHRILCLRTKERNNSHPMEHLNEAWKHMHYPPETSTIMIIPRLLATILQSPNPEQMQEAVLQFTHRAINEDAQLVHKLLGEKFADQLLLLHNLLLQAVPHEGIEQFLTLEGFQSLLALIGTNGQGVGTSAVSQWVTRSSELPLPDAEKQQLDNFIDKLYEDMDRVSGNFLNNEGVALFSLQSSCNHSCVPNAEPTYLHNNSRLSLVSLRDIEAGEEITISYLDECNLQRSRHSRHKVLMENYLFVCNCLKCEEQVNEPDVTSDEEEDDEEEMSE
uniref:SET domain-containing protein n=1 Tax=Photinus pyralis TaxID=7054 RepID=A0A1Y1L0P8_PHOPY